MNRILLPVCLCVMILSACGGQTETPKEISQELFLTDSLQNVVSVDTVYTHEVTDELTLNGRVTFNQEQVARVFPIFGGTVTEVSAEIGDHVRKGDVLAIIRSGEVADYEKQKKEAEKLELTRKKAMDKLDFYERVVRSVAREENEVSDYYEIMGEKKQRSTVMLGTAPEEAPAEQQQVEQNAAPTEAQATPETKVEEAK